MWVSNSTPVCYLSHSLLHFLSLHTHIHTHAHTLHSLSNTNEKFRNNTWLFTTQSFVNLHLIMLVPHLNPSMICIMPKKNPYFVYKTPIPFMGEGNDNPLQCSCLENPRDRGAWWAAVYGVAQIRTQLKRLSSSSSIPFMSWTPSHQKYFNHSHLLSRKAR